MTNQSDLPGDGEPSAGETPDEAGTRAPAEEARDDRPVTTEAPDGPEAANQPAPDPESTPWTGPSAWVFPGLVAFFGGVAVWGALTIDAPPNSEPPGPGMVPGVIGTLLLLVAGWMAVVNLRVANGLRAGRISVAATPPTDWPPVLIIVGTLAAHIALLEVLGWLLAGALLFWGVSYAFGARAYLRDAVVSLSMSAAVQVGFSFGLGLKLPGGIVELML